MLGLANAQAALGVEVMIAGKEAPGYELPPVLHPGIKTTFWKQRGGSFIGRIMRPGPRACEFEPLSRFAPDVVHVHGEFNPDNLCVPSRVSCPLVVSPHGCFHPGVFDKRRSSQKRLYFRLARQLLYRHAAMHATSPLEARHISALLPAQEVYCAPLGPGVQSPCVVGDGRTLAGPGAKLLFVGRLDIYTKGLDILLEAFALAFKRMPSPGAALHLVGADQNGSRQRLELIARSLGIGHQVHLHGQAAPTDVARFLADADIYVQLSRHEGFGLSIVEAFAAGLPAVLSDGIGVVSYPEVQRLEHVAIVKPDIAEAAAAIERAVANRIALREQASAHVSELREFFSWESAAAMQIERYRALRRPAAELMEMSVPGKDNPTPRPAPLSSAGR
ncbi:MAG: glycosyltransferase family 4 protein [Planctomycetes bacterium]|nr:glycosyltransferase family 4 protein [Planctomycetota bacterium]